MPTIKRLAVSLALSVLAMPVGAAPIKTPADANGPAQTEIPPPSGKGRVVIVVSGALGPDYNEDYAERVAKLGYDTILLKGRRHPVPRQAGRRPAAAGHRTGAGLLQCASRQGSRHWNFQGRRRRADLCDKAAGRSFGRCRVLSRDGVSLEVARELEKLCGNIQGAGSRAAGGQGHLQELLPPEHDPNDRIGCEGAWIAV